MSSTRGMNGSTHGRESLAAKRERYESESAAARPDRHHEEQAEPSARRERTRPQTTRAKN